MTSVLRVVPQQRTAVEDLAAALLAQQEERAEALADAVHDGVLQALVVARYAADASARGGDPALARDAVQEALVALRRLVWELRPRGASGLNAALRELAAQRLAAGLAPLLLDLAPDAAGEDLGPAVARAAYRLVQRAADQLPLTVRLTRTSGAVLLELDRALPDAPSELLHARAVGAVLHVGPTSTTLRLPLTRIPTEETP